MLQNVIAQKHDVCAYVLMAIRADYELSHATIEVVISIFS
jgi:hypothetical protein